jgi:choline monooxygenase
VAVETLPWSWYSDPEILRAEQERILRRSWQYVGPVERVREPGERLTALLGDVPC